VRGDAADTWVCPLRAGRRSSWDARFVLTRNSQRPDSKATESLFGGAVRPNTPLAPPDTHLATARRRDDPPYVMRQVGHSDPKVTLGIYAQVMLRRDGEPERLRALVRGGTGIADPRPGASPQVAA